jgi:hypothetical protein
MGSINSKIASRADLNSLSAAEVALIVKSLGKAYEPIADAIVENDLNGKLVNKALDNEAKLHKYLDGIRATGDIQRDNLIELLSDLRDATPVALTLAVKGDDKANSAVDIASLTNDRCFVIACYLLYDEIPKILRTGFVNAWNSSYPFLQWGHDPKSYAESGRICWLGSHKAVDDRNHIVVTDKELFQGNVTSFVVDLRTTKSEKYLLL